MLNTARKLSDVEVPDATEVFSKLKDVFGLERDRDLAMLLGIGADELCRKKRLNRVAYKKIVRLAKLYDLSLDKLLLQ